MGAAQRRLLAVLAPKRCFLDLEKSCEDNFGVHGECVYAYARVR